jgi:WhiB family redox-sensing transcriptional regulator
MLAPLTLDHLTDALVAAADPAWDDAACRDGSDVSTQLFFSDAIPDITRAKAICARCPVVASCLEGALDRREPWGVWGGQLFKDGAVLAFKRPRGRPPKVRPTEGEVALTA